MLVVSSSVEVQCRSSSNGPLHPPGQCLFGVVGWEVHRRHLHATVGSRRVIRHAGVDCGAPLRVLHGTDLETPSCGWDGSKSSAPGKDAAELLCRAIGDVAPPQADADVGLTAALVSCLATPSLHERARVKQLPRDA
eukprot:CAMPEP_0171150450 /NCGR_PEP_ID=MMETSP0766_2-20121228/149575_1 /TAXON_ID=439317 /ORGANISM="Gambierdiscus australes, Strain CAWD 149" /LENGTH=136 /DNA_ID=CAMNT_0011614363 /DNA_START=618 /DNA_END=1025 /DNA_ORIENTATION=+